MVKKMQYEEILKLIREVAKSGLSHFEIEEENLKISMDGAKVAAADPQDPEGIAVKEAGSTAVNGTKEIFKEFPSNDSTKKQETESYITSPLVGTFYIAESEGAKPYVSVGDRVKPGDIVAIVEAMKLMNEIEADREGIIAEVMVEDGQNVEYGQPLYRLV